MRRFVTAVTVVAFPLAALFVPVVAALAQDAPSDTDAVAPQAETPPKPGPAAETDAAAPELDRVNELIRSRDWQEAADILASLLADAPADATLNLMQGEVLIALGRMEQAIPHLRKTVEAEPSRPRANFQLGIALAAIGQVEPALEAFAAELATESEVPVRAMAHLNRYVLYQQRGLWNEAAREMEAVLTLSPERIDAWGDLAAAYLEAGRLDDARAALERAAAAGFESASHYQSLAALYFKKERWAESAACFERAIELDPSLAEARRGLEAARTKLAR